MQNKLPLPIGASNYKLVSTEYYYVDKTLLIKELLDERAVITLFTRPRRFGKTLNMDMLRTFFEKTPEDTSKYFKDKNLAGRRKIHKSAGKISYYFSFSKGR